MHFIFRGDRHGQRRFSVEKIKEHILELEQFQGKRDRGFRFLYFPLLSVHTGVKNCFYHQRGWMQHRDVPEPESEFYTWR